uniref:hypothetical protein n=1 Tax=Escherichia marmotae TaxID=1499973 RepID=UPI001E2B59D8
RAAMPDVLRLSGLQEHKCRPDKAVTPHPATVRRCLMRFAYQAYGSTNVGRIRRSRRIRQPCGDA